MSDAVEGAYGTTAERGMSPETAPGRVFASTPHARPRMREVHLHPAAKLFK